MRRARSVAQFGMSSALGPQALAHLSGGVESRYLPGLILGGERQYSERTQQLIDAEVSELLRLAFQRAVELLEHNRAQLLDLAARLREKEVLEGDELRQVLAGAEAPSALSSPDEQQWLRGVEH
jgi:cell division protease FtsH